MTWIKIKKKWFSKDAFIDIFWEFLGSFIVAVAVYNFALNSEFPMTGFSGIAMIFYRLFGWPIGTVTILMNIPVAFICYKVIGRDFLIKSIRCIIVSSFMIDYVTPLLPVYDGSRMLSAIVTGTLCGIGYAVIYMRNSSTGGADFLILAAKTLKPHIKLGTIVFLSDLFTVLIGGFIFRDIDGIIYGIIITFLCSAVVDKVMNGVNSGKVGLIVTDYGEEVCDVIDDCCGRGSTILHGKGGYKKGAKQVVMVACSPKEMYTIEKAVNKNTDDTFMIVMDANEIHGEGFHFCNLG